MRPSAPVLFALGLLSSAQAQLDQSPSDCSPLTYVLRLQPGTSSRMQVSAALNGGPALKINSAKSSASVKTDVTAQIKPAGNVLKVQWTVLGDANKADTRTSWISLQMGSGQRYTPVAIFRTDYYPGRKALTFNFDAPPTGSVRCDSALPQYTVTLGRASSGERVTQYTLQVGTRFYAITSNEPSDIGHGLQLDLKPYLKHGKNEVKLLWQVLKQQNVGDEVGAQITRSAQGKTQVLAKTIVKGKQGETGQLAASITVP